MFISSIKVFYCVIFLFKNVVLVPAIFGILHKKIDLTENLGVRTPFHAEYESEVEIKFGSH